MQIYYSHTYKHQNVMVLNDHKKNIYDKFGDLVCPFSDFLPNRYRLLAFPETFLCEIYQRDIIYIYIYIYIKVRKIYKNHTLLSCNFMEICKNKVLTNKVDFQYFGLTISSMTKVEMSYNYFPTFWDKFIQVIDLSLWSSFTKVWFYKSMQFMTSCLLLESGVTRISRTV